MLHHSASRSKVAILMSLAFFLTPQLGLAASGGPDTYGYRWQDNNPAANSCSYNFVDIATTGTEIGTGDDTVFSGVPIGFSFNYYGTAYTAVNVATNGYLAFATTGSSFSNSCPQPVTLNDLQVSPFWDDLYILGPSTLRYQVIGSAPNRTFIVQWNNVGFCCTSPPSGPGMTFQAQLWEGSNIIAFMYTDMQQNAQTRGSSATIGIDGPGTTNYLAVTCNTTNAVSNGYAVFFLPPGVSSCSLLVATTTTIVSSLSPSPLGFPVTFTAQVTENVLSASDPTGSVLFRIDGVPATTVPIDASGAATYTTGALATGNHTVVAEYGGDANFEPSNSTPLTQVVLPPAIPTVSGWGLLLLGLVLLGPGILLLRDRRRRAAG
jgi:hypothetical protein